MLEELFSVEIRERGKRKPSRRPLIGYGAESANPHAVQVGLPFSVVIDPETVNGDAGEVPEEPLSYLTTLAAIAPPTHPTAIPPRTRSAQAETGRNPGTAGAITLVSIGPYHKRTTR